MSSMSFRVHFVNLNSIVKVMLYVTSLLYMGNKDVLKVELTFWLGEKGVWIVMVSDYCTLLSSIWIFWVMVFK